MDEIKKEFKSEYSVSAEEFYLLWERAINSEYVKEAIKNQFNEEWNIAFENDEIKHF